MSMLPNPLNVQAPKADRHENDRSRKEPKPFDRRADHIRVSNEVKEKTLAALRHVLKAEREKANATCAAAADAEQTNLHAVHQAVKSQATGIEASAEVTNLFEKLVRQLMVIHDKGIQKTTFFLKGEAFASSIFRGAKITVVEFSTAPKVFNIQFDANEAALALFSKHSESLFDILNEGKFGFHVHRLETGNLEEEDRDDFVEKIGDDAGEEHD